MPHKIDKTQHDERRKCRLQWPGNPGQRRTRVHVAPRISAICCSYIRNWCAASVRQSKIGMPSILAATTTSCRRGNKRRKTECAYCWARCCITSSFRSTAVMASIRRMWRLARRRIMLQYRLDLYVGQKTSMPQS